MDGRLIFLHFVCIADGDVIQDRGPLLDEGAREGEADLLPKHVNV